MQAQSNERLLPTFQTIIDCFPGAVSKFNSELKTIACNQTFRDLPGFPEDLFKDGLAPFRDLAPYNAKRDDYGSSVPEQGIAPNEASTNNTPCT